jgi:miniconductance mechanosensitive channel
MVEQFCEYDTIYIYTYTYIYIHFNRNMEVCFLIEFIKDFLVRYGLSEQLSLYFSNAVAVLFILLLSTLAYLIAKKYLLKALMTLIYKSKTKWDDILIRNKVFERAIRIIPALVIYSFAPLFPSLEAWIQRIVFCYILFIVIIVLDKLLDTVDEIYRNFDISKERPIKGFLQVIKIISYTIGLIVIVATLMERSPWVLISGIGAATAILLLIFQNSILGLVASIQLASNNMVMLGDWIEMPKYGADGAVIEISLHTVKVQNWDKTITTIPTHSLISESFKNWRGMQQSGGRRIKRSVCIDMTSIKFCTDEMLEKYKKIQYIREYIETKNKEIEEYNKKHQIDPSTMVNGRHLTNIGTFRAYIQQYLNNHPKIHGGMIRMVRQLAPTDKGLPIEIYAFTNDTAWVNYESIQADIFDHILAVIPEFDLRIFQAPTGHDLQQIKSLE